MKRKDVLRQAIIDLSPDPSTTIFNRRPAPLAPKLKTKLPTTQHDIDNPVIGTGIFAHNATEAIPYDLLLQRLFLQQNHFPSLNTYGENEGNVVKPYIVAMGKKRTIFANFQDVHKSIKRDKSHVFVLPFEMQDSRANTSLQCTIYLQRARHEWLVRRTRKIIPQRTLRLETYRQRCQAIRCYLW
jgi:hypothetical protein